MFPLFVSYRRRRFMYPLLLAFAMIVLLIMGLRRTYMLRQETKVLWVNDVHMCSIHAAFIYSTSVLQFMGALRRCLARHVTVRADHMEEFSGYGDARKAFFLPLMPQRAPRSCFWLAIGVGGEAKAEKRFTQTYPECTVVGVGPVFEGESEFHKYGSMFMVDVVFGKDDKRTLADGATPKFPTVPLPQFLDEHFGTRLVHFLTLNYRGHEYRMLRELAAEGALTREGVEFCQIDVELHNLKSMDTVPEARNVSLPHLLLTVMRPPSPYVPVFSSSVPEMQRQKVTFVNIRNPECQSAFKFQRFFV